VVGEAFPLCIELKSFPQLNNIILGSWLSTHKIYDFWSIYLSVLYYSSETRSRSLVLMIIYSTRSSHHTCEGVIHVRMAVKDKLQSMTERNAHFNSLLLIRGIHLTRRLPWGSPVDYVNINFGTARATGVSQDCIVYWSLSLHGVK
jgi:hypothetical protein